MTEYKSNEWRNKVKTWMGYLPATCPFCDELLSLAHADNPFDILYCKKHGYLKIDSLNGVLTILEEIEHSEQIEIQRLINSKAYKLEP